MNGAPLTLLLITAGRVARADYDAAGAATSLMSAPREHDGAIPSAVRTALALGGKPAGLVWVLLEDAWIQNIELQKRQITGLSREQISRALSFEIEPFSGTPVAQSEIGFIETEDRDAVKCYWAAEIAVNVRDAVQDVIAAAGGKLGGICHPGGLPLPLDPALDCREWRRLEVWHGSLLSLEGDGGRPARARVLSGPPARSTAISAVALELLTETRTTPVGHLDSGVAAKRFVLDEPEHLRAWLQGWATQLRSGPPSAPVIGPRPAKPGPQKYIVVGAALEAFVILVCPLLVWHGTYVRNRLRTERGALARVADQTKAVTKENTDLRKEIATLDQQAQKMALLARRRTAFPNLLRALASTRPDDIVLSNILPNGPGEIIVHGLALDALSVDEMCLALTAALHGDGWAAQPLQKTSKGNAAESGPWDFTISLAPMDAKPVAISDSHLRRP